MKKTCHRILSGSMLALAVAATGGCSLFSNESRFEPVALTEYQQQVTGFTVWSANVGSGSGYGFAPALVGNSVYAATPDGSVVKANLSNGSIQWRTKLDEELAAGVGSDGNIAVVTTTKGKVIALDASGKELWTANASTIASTPPAIGGGLVIVRADDYRVQAFNAQNGELQWSYLRTNPEMALKANSRMLIDGNQVLVGVPTGRLVSLDLQTGTPRWDILAATIQGPTDLDSVTDVVGQPLLSGNGLCIATYQGRVGCYAISANGAQPVWNQPFSSAVGVGAAGNSLYAASVHGEVRAYNITNGQELWTDQTLTNRGLTNPVVYGNVVATGDYEGYVHFYSAANGTLLGRVSAGSGQSIVSPVTATNIGILVQNGSGNLVMLGVK